MKENKYGYKVCYQEIGKHKFKIHLVCNSYDYAVWRVQYYETNPQYDRKTHHLIHNPTWKILPIKTYMEYSKLWRGCSFRDYLSDFLKGVKQ